MNELDLLKRIPKEHYTTHNGKIIKVEDLIRLLGEKDKKFKNTNK